MNDVRAMCRTYPGITKEQLELCYRASDVTAVAMEGLMQGVKECQYQVGKLSLLQKYVLLYVYSVTAIAIIFIEKI